MNAPDNPSEGRPQEVSPEPAGEVEVLPVPTPVRMIDLHDAHAIRRELASVYRDMRAGRIETQDGTRLAYVLDGLRKAYESCLLQRRLDALERLLTTRKEAS